jgi:hypothetical protein
VCVHTGHSPEFLAEGFFKHTYAHAHPALVLHHKLQLSFFVETCTHDVSARRTQQIFTITKQSVWVHTPTSPNTIDRLQSKTGKVCWISQEVHIESGEKVGVPELQFSYFDFVHIRSLPHPKHLGPVVMPSANTLMDYS